MTLTPAQRRLLDRSRNLILATIHPDGRPQLTPVWYLWDGQRFWISVPGSTVKVRNVRRDPRVTMCLDGDALGVREYVQVEGLATIVDEDQEATTLRLIRRYIADDAAAVRRWEVIREGRVLIRVEPRVWQWRD